MTKVKRTDAQRTAITAAVSKDMSLDCLTNEARSSGIFIKPGTAENYSQSWVIDRLRRNDKKVAQKLVEFSATI